MPYSSIENNPITVNLVTQANDTGWSLPGDGTAVHQSCNSGNLTLLNYPVLAGHTYLLTYTVQIISGGYIQSFVGATGGVQYTTSQIVQDTLTATTNDPIKIFSTANTTIAFFNIKDITISDGVC